MDYKFLCWIFVGFGWYKCVGVDGFFFMRVWEWVDEFSCCGCEVVKIRCMMVCSLCEYFFCFIVNNLVIFGCKYMEKFGVLDFIDWEKIVDKRRYILNVVDEFIWVVGRNCGMVFVIYMVMLFFC